MGANPLKGKLEVLTPREGRKGSIALTKLSHLRTELAALYREARTGKIDTQDATRLAYLLQILAKIIETGDIEKRLEQLEAAQEQSNNGKFR